MRLNKFLTCFTALLALAGFATALPAQAEEVTIHGSTTVYSNLFEPHQLTLENSTGLKLNIIANGSSRGLQGLADGEADIAMISSGLASTAAKIGADAADFTAEQVGEERIVYVVHPANPVSSLTKEQIIGILSGDITNWSAVGGNAAPIMVATEYAGGGFRTTVEKKLLGGNAISAPNLKEMPNAPQVVKMGEQVPVIFAAIPQAMVKDSTMKTLEAGDAEIVQPLILVAKGEPSAAFTKLVEKAKQLLQQ